MVGMRLPWDDGVVWMQPNPQWSLLLALDPDGGTRNHQLIGWGWRQNKPHAGFGVGERKEAGI